MTVNLEPLFYYLAGCLTVVLLAIWWLRSVTQDPYHRIK